MNNSSERRSSVSVLRLAYAPLVKDTKDMLTYGDMVEMDNVLVSAGYTPRMNSASQYASGQEYDSYVAKSGGSIEIQVPSLNSSDEIGLFGCTKDEATGVVASNKGDVVPNVMVIYSTETSQGLVNLYKFPKVKFTDQGETATTKNENGVTYQSQTLSGNYSALIHTGDEKFNIKGVDPKSDEGKELIKTWFSSAVGGTKLGEATPETEPTA